MREGRIIAACAAQAHQRVALANVVVQRRPIGEPYMWKTGAGPCRRNVCHKFRLGPLALFRPDDGRSAINIAKLGPDHLVALALLDIGDAGEVGASRSAFGRLVADVWLVGCTPPSPPARGMARRLDVAGADLPPLNLVRAKKSRPGPTRDRRSKFPRQIDGIPDAAVHAQPPGPNHPMRRIAGKKHPAPPVA